MSTEKKWWEIEDSYQQFEVEDPNMLNKVLCQITEIVKWNSGTGSGIEIEAGGAKWKMFVQKIDFTDGLSAIGYVMPNFNGPSKDTWLNVDYDRSGESTVTLRIRQTL